VIAHILCYNNTESNHARTIQLSSHSYAMHDITIILSIYHNQIVMLEVAGIQAILDPLYKVQCTYHSLYVPLLSYSSLIMISYKTSISDHRISV